MVDFETLNYENKIEWSNAFLTSLLETNQTYEYFVNWEKVFLNLDNYVTEINIIDSLGKIPLERRKSKLKELIIQYPEIIRIIPSIIAVRNEKINVFDESELKVKNFIFAGDKINADEIVEFCDNVGIIKLFDYVDDLYTYLVGTEVGLDTNARKNRSGTIFENLIESLIKKKLIELEDYSVISQDCLLDLDRKKRFDFLIYENNKPKYGIECNFYSSTGSKPIEVAHAYADLSKQLKNSDIKFIWVTDGIGWMKMFNSLSSVVEDIDYIVNYNMFNEKFYNIVK